MSDLLHQFDAEWNHLASAPTTQVALRRWAHAEPDLAEYSDLQHLHTVAHDRDDVHRSDRLLAALVRLAACDSPHHHGGDLLATRVLLQLLLPGVTRMARQLATMLGGHDTALAAVLAELTIRIKTYPWHRRPHKTAANLLLDTRQRITRAYQRNRREITDGLDPHPTPPAAHDSHDSLHLRDLLGWAVRSKAINVDEARLLVAWHVEQLPLPQLMHRFGRSRTTLFQHRSLAETKLRNALQPHRRARESAATPMG